jgi:hypothetical protein
MDSILASSQNDYKHRYFDPTAQSSLVSYFCDVPEDVLEDVPQLRDSEAF